MAIVIPNFNRTTFLDEALDSVFCQDFLDWRCYIVDDGSQNKSSSAIIRKWQKKDHRFTGLSQAHKGVSAARNLGIITSTEPWISLLDSDDLWKPDKLSTLIQEAEKHPAMLWHSEEIWIRYGKRVNPKKKHQKGGGDQFAESAKLCVISPSAALFPRKKLTKWGIFDERFPVAEDYDFWLRITAHAEVGFINKPLIIKKGGHPDQLSRTPMIDLWRVRALDKIIRYGDLKIDKRKTAAGELKKKLMILSAGARKRGNRSILEYINELGRFHSKAEKNFQI